MASIRRTQDTRRFPFPDAQRIDLLRALAQVDPRTAQRFACGLPIARDTTRERLEKAERQVVLLESTEV